MLIGALSNIDPSTIILALLFIIFFVFIQLVLSRSLKDKNSASIIALCVALLAVYGISKTGFDISEFSYNLGITDNIIYDIIPFIVLGGLIFLFWKVRMRFIMVFLGLGLMIGSFFAYEQKWVLIAGIVFLVIGLWLMYKESKRRVKKRIYLK
jgi:predicted branched-subunit amino acid permease